MKPAFKITANDDDITDKLKTRLERMTLTDGTDDEADNLSLTLCNHDGTLPLPTLGAVLKVWLGWQGEPLQAMGAFVVDAVGYRGMDTIEVQAQASPVATSKQFGHLQSHRDATYPATTVGGLVATLAKRHGLKPNTSKSLANKALPAQHQQDESDLAFLMKVVEPFGGIIKATGGALVCVKRGEPLTINGTAIPSVTITPSLIEHDSLNYDEQSKETGGSVVAKYKTKANKATQQVTLGGGNPTTHLKRVYTSEAQAREAAQAEQQRRNQKGITVSMDLVRGDPRLLSHSPILLQGFPPRLNRKYILTKVEHSLSPSEGFTTSLEAEAL